MKRYKPSKNILAITTGDEDGIGLEVSVKALLKLEIASNSQFVLFRSEGKRFSEPLIRLLDRKYHRIQVKNYLDALNILESKNSSRHKNIILDIASRESPAEWVEEVSKSCFQNQIQGMITGPLSKPKIREAGFKDLGHTDILKRVSHAKFVNMAFLGRKFNVVLTTGHIPISEVAKKLKKDLLMRTYQNCCQLLDYLSPQKRLLPIGLLGLNPHAGDDGLIGKEETKLFREILNESASFGRVLDGPLIPDVAFRREYWKKYSVYMAIYHDQGLIPFKMAHGFEGTHMTLGIPFIRTSVDHGTAKDIFAKDKANCNSMLDSIKWCIKLADSRSRVQKL